MPFLLKMENLSVIWKKKKSHLDLFGLIHIRLFLTCLLLCKGDIGVHQAPRDAVGNKDDNICFLAENISCTVSPQLQLMFGFT